MNFLFFIGNLIVSIVVGHLYIELYGWLLLGILLMLQALVISSFRYLDGYYIRRRGNLNEKNNEN